MKYIVFFGDLVSGESYAEAGTPEAAEIVALGLQRLGFPQVNVLEVSA